jgi:hypothetical protein
VNERITRLRQSSLRCDLLHDTLYPDARRAYLLDRLDDLKSEAIRDFADGGLKGEGVRAGVTALVNDTRSSLAAGSVRLAFIPPGSMPN